jgi:hypothetical protein
MRGLQPPRAIGGLRCRRELCADAAQVRVAPSGLSGSSCRWTWCSPAVIAGVSSASRESAPSTRLRLPTNDLAHVVRDSVGS